MEFVIHGKQPKKTDKIALIDADYIMYKTVPKLKVNEDISALCNLIDVEISTLREYFKAKHMLFCFSGEPDNYFRNHIAIDKKYKGNRERSMNHYRDAIVTYIKYRYATLIFNELEADDILCMLQDEDTFIYSEDKDMQQIPGTHWDLKKELFYEIDEFQAFDFLMSQVIMGDSVDNIGGLKDYGLIKTSKLLTNCSSPQSLINVTINEYIKVHGVVNGIDAFTEMWNLVKLRGNRGTYFKERYQFAFETLELLKQS